MKQAYVGKGCHGHRHSRVFNRRGIRKALLAAKPSRHWIVCARSRSSVRKLRTYHRRYRPIAARRRALAAVTPYAGPNGTRWAIPWPIVSCESHGDFSAYNRHYEPDGPGSGPGGAYQIIRSTWQGHGGRGVASGAPPDEQHLVASRIWNGGAGRGQWQC